MLRVNMNIAIVSMTGGSAAASNASTFVASECLRPDLSNNNSSASFLDEDMSAAEQVCASSLDKNKNALATICHNKRDIILTMDPLWKINAYFLTLVCLQN